jgi:DNA repair protein RadC
MYQLNPGLASDRSNRDLLPDFRPREKLEVEGLESLSECELLSLVLGRGCPGVPVQEMGRDLTELIFLPDGSARIPTLKECLAIRGLGKAKAAAVMAGLELGRRMQTVRGRPIHAPQDALSHLQWLSRESREHFQVLYLDTRRRLLSSKTISIGTLEASLVHPREVFRAAVEHSASSILVAHNHPSGDPEPSPEDLALTNRLDRAARLLGIRLVDHLIIAGTEWISLRQRQNEGLSGVELFAA